MRKISPAPCSVVIDVDVSEKGTDSVAGAVKVRWVCEPVGVEVIAFRDAVFYELDGFEVGGGDVVALEGEGAVLNAADDGFS